MQGKRVCGGGSRRGEGVWWGLTKRRGCVVGTHEEERVCGGGSQRGEGVWWGLTKRRMLMMLCLSSAADKLLCLLCTYVHVCMRGNTTGRELLLTWLWRTQLSERWMPRTCQWECSGQGRARLPHADPLLIFCPYRPVSGSSDVSSDIPRARCGQRACHGP